MKNLIPVYIISFICIALCLWSCGNSDEDNPTSSTVTYTVDGVEVTSRASGVISIFVDESDSTVLDIFESKFGGLDMELIFTVPSIENLVGTYQVTDDNWILLFDGTGSPASLLRSTLCTNSTGTITITEHDAAQRTLNGSFEGQVCTGGGSARSISGTFDGVRYVTQVQVDIEE